METVKSHGPVTGTMRPIKNDLTGQRYGRLTVEGRVVVDGRTRWRCRCDCGNMVDVISQNLIFGNTRSCGCYRRERRHDIQSKQAPVGTRYGRLTVEGYEGPYAMVLCDCGVRKRVRNKHLLDGSTQSCGCLRREMGWIDRTAHKNTKQR